MTTIQSLYDVGEANTEQVGSGVLFRLLPVIQRVGRPCVVCSRIPLGHQEVVTLLSSPSVESVILESEDRQLLASFPDHLGYYKEGGADWQLPLKAATDMVYIGRWTDFGVRAAWHAWRAGIRRIHVFSGLQPELGRGLLLVAGQKLLRSLLYRLWKLSLGLKLAESTGLAFRGEQFLFSRRLRALERSTLPIADTPSSWRRGRIVMVGGTLGPGGAERQLTATLLGLFVCAHRDLHFLHHSPMHKPNDFFLPSLIEAGIPFSQVIQFSNGSEIKPEVEADLTKNLSPLGDLGGEIAAYAREFIVRRPEIVHLWLDHMNVVAGLAGLLVGVPRIVLSCRSLSPAHFAFNQPYMRPIYRLLAKHPNVTFLNNSEAGAADYSRWLGLNQLNIQVLRNGFDFASLPPSQELPQLRSEYRRRLGIPAAAPVVGVIMRISEEKRPLLWVEIARLVAQKIPKAHFLMVGNGPMRDQVELRARAVLAGRVHFPGHERNATMPLAAMDIFLLTSRVEGLPNVLIEAQAVGVPPVAIDAGGARETLIDDKTGWLIASSKPSVVAQKIIYLLSEPARLADASGHTHEFVRNRFGLERMIDETLAVYGYSNAH